MRDYELKYKIIKDISLKDSYENSKIMGDFHTKAIQELALKILKK